MAIADTIFVKDANAATQEIRTNPAVQAVSGSVAVENWPIAQPVSGTFWQATQPVSLASVPSHAVTGPLTDTQLRAAAVPVSGTFWQATQPVSLATNTPDVTDRAARLLGHVTVDNASIPVTGAFFQATQPVSIASMPSTPVTGTFWQATQPVSIASMPSTPVTGTFWQATQPVSGPLTDTQLRATPVAVADATWPWPSAVTPVAQQSGVLAASAGTATLAAVAAKFTYLQSVQIFGTGATATSVVNATIAGILGGTMTIPVVVPAGVSLAITPITLTFSPPLRSSAVNTAIVVSLPSLGAGSTRATVNAQGFQQ